MTSKQTSIGKCNSGWIAVEESAHLETPGKFEVGPNLTRLDTGRRFAPSATTARVDYFQLEDVIFDGHTGAIFKDMAHIAETRYSTPEAHHFQVDTARVVRRSDVRTTFVGFHAWHNNYYHWITQCVPAIYWACKTGDQATAVFALPALSDWQEQALQIAGLAEIYRYTVDHQHQYEAARLAYTTITQGATTYRPSRACSEVFHAMRSQVKIDSVTPDSVLYVSRQDVTTRKMDNEAELCDRLEAEGVQIVVPGNFSVAEQIALFSRARLVLGPHGAGLTNIAFCAPGTILYEIMSSRSPNPCFASLAQSAGMQYCAEAFPQNDPGSDDLGWTADAAEVVRTACRLRDRSAK